MGKDGWQSMGTAWRDRPVLLYCPDGMMIVAQWDVRTESWVDPEETEDDPEKMNFSLGEKVPVRWSELPPAPEPPLLGWES